jgi:hypothetical protein
MSVIIQGSQVRQILFGVRLEKSTGTLAATTVPLFTVTGGEVALTAIYGLVTTSITVANSYKLQHNPTLAGATTNDLCAATDIGTTDTPAGDVLSFDGIRTTQITRGGGANTLRTPVVLQAGQIESVSAGTDGAILWVVTYVPLTDGATMVAA